MFYIITYYVILANKKKVKYLFLPEKECKTHWKRLREQYRKAIRFRCEATGRRRPWKLELEMSFLLPHMKEITYIPRYSYEGGKSEEDSAIENLNCEGSEEETDLINLLPASPEATVFLDSSGRDSSKRSSADATKSNHPLINFFTCLGETTLTLPHHLQMEVKRKVFDAVHQAEIAALNDKVSSTKSELE